MSSKPLWPVVRRSWRQDGWAVEMATALGRVRQRQEDSWQVGFDWPLAGRRADVFAVFDGLGGEANGDKASHAAAEGLKTAMRATPGADSLLPELNKAVTESRGMTTAVVAAFVRGGSDFLLAVGDSSAFAMVGGSPTLLVAHDVDPNTGGIGDQLGVYFRGGHAVPFALNAGQSILLCTDGVDGVVEMPALQRLLQATPDRMAEAVDALMQDIHAKGAPDNAALILARRV